MKVYVFDLLAYDHHFEGFKANRYLPYPLPGRHFDPEIPGAQLRGTSRGVARDGSAWL